MLTDAQKNQLKERLLAERERLLNRGDEHTARVAEMTDDMEDEGSIGSEADQASDVTLAATDIALRNDALETVALIDHALERLADGTYGLSEVSGQPIPYERLEALPWATRTVEEQSRTDAQSDPLGGGDVSY